MATTEQVTDLAQIVLCEIKHWGNNAPFVAYADVRDRHERYFILRANEAPRRTPSSRSTHYVRYRVPLGRLAECQPGGAIDIKVPEVIGRNTFTGHFFVTTYNVWAKDTFRVPFNLFDAIENQIGFVDGSIYAPSLLQLLAEVDAQKRALPVRRRLADKFELADIAVSDRKQGDIWRVPMRKLIVIEGAPGTGKTTTSIKRIAQKTDAAAMVEAGEVGDVSVDNLKKWLGGSTNWVLFTPSDLLRGYLQQALAQEGLPATEDRVPVWSTLKVTIARDVLRLIGKERYFSLSQNLVSARENKSRSAWAKAFNDWFRAKSEQELRRQIEQLRISLQDAQRAIEGAVQSLVAQIEPLQKQLKKIRVQEEQAISEQSRKSLRYEGNEIERQIEPLNRPLTTLNEALALWHDVISLLAIGGDLARTIKNVRELDWKISKFLERHPQNTWPDLLFGSIDQLSAAAKTVASSICESSGAVIDPILRKVAPAYQQFRLLKLEEHNFYFKEKLALVNNSKIEALELDVLIWMSLSLLRESFAIRELEQKSGSSITQKLINEMRFVVAVDEATDFSAVELACIRLLAHPLFDCVTFAGDPMQRMTGQGITHWSDLNAFIPGLEKFELKVSYRQSPTLLKVASKLYEKTIGQAALFTPGFASQASDPPPLQFHGTEEDQINWIAQRVGEIERNCGKLPSIAVLVPSDDDVVRIANALREPLLNDFSIETEACVNGLVLGTQSKVRVFSASFIKGLEFEAVFFMGVDKMAAMSPDLVEKFLYVGLTRARTFLAVTTTSAFPAQLTHVQQFFRNDDWKSLAGGA